MKTSVLRVVAVGLLASWSVVAVAQPIAEERSASGQASVREDLKVARSLSRAFNHAATTIEPSVVHITEFSRTVERQGFFGPAREVIRPTGAGSGVIVTSDGYILTNHHVIAGAEKVRVKLADDREFDGRVIGSDPATDLGVVKVEASNLKAAEWGDSDALEVGEWVIAVGSPFGQFNNSVTAGIVSAKGRTGLTALSEERFEDFIQTDAAINPGNSGGPLVNLEGQVVGINSQIASRSGGSVGIGFSIPTSIARSVMDMLIRNGRADRGAIGINDLAVPPAEMMRALQVRSGVRIGAVVEGGPADKAGLKAGDVITRFNGRVIDSVNRLRNAIAFTPPGSAAEVERVRDGKSAMVTLTVGDRSDFVPGSQAVKRFGFAVKTVPPADARRLGLNGVYVSEIEVLGPAAQAPTPLQRGDIIVALNNREVADAEEFDIFMRRYRGESLRLNVIRPGWPSPQRGYIDLTARQ
ncbi:MAG: trypsin-like peptidase domain-containing protein [Phycisphaeraceae bacterium]|nr:trypsin-like peptidase domain-containing protein [Phycisphaeraceae bacterium]